MQLYEGLDDDIFKSPVKASHDFSLSLLFMESG